MRASNRRSQRRRIGAAVFTTVFVILGVSALVAGSGRSTKVESGSTTTAAVRRPVTLSPVAPGTTIVGDTPCPPAAGSEGRTTQFAKPPPMCINPNKAYTAEIRTGKGSFVVALDAKAAPMTVNNFVVLARYRFYEGIPFHRIVPGFVAQVGDPQASGLGGPGYKFDDELPAAGAYKIGSLAMANTGSANTNGSQFFIVTGEAGLVLPPSYSLFGQVTQGMDVVKAIEAVGTQETPGDPTGGRPTELVTILSIDIKES